MDTDVKMQMKMMIEVGSESVVEMRMRIRMWTRDGHGSGWRWPNRFVVSLQTNPWRSDRPGQPQI